MIEEKKCKNCGAPLKNIGYNRYKCEYCGSIYEENTHHIFIEVERLSNDSDEMKVKEEIREFIRSLKLKNVKELNIGKNQYLLSIKLNKKINIYNNTIY